MKTINFTCDLCGKTWIGESWSKITLSFYDNIQFNTLYVPNKKYEDLCIKCFDDLRKAIEKVIEEKSLK